MPSPQGEFCCAGCAYVYRLIHDAGLGSYYRIKDEVTVPAEAALGPVRDHGWLETAQREAEAAAAGRTPRLALAVQGLSCAGCVWLIERLFAKEPGAGRIEINAQTGQLQLSWEPGRFSAARFAETLQRFNYLLGPAGTTNADQAESRVLARRIGLCAAFAMNVMLFTLPAYFGMAADFAYAHLFDTLALAFATLSLLAGGGYFLARAVRALRERALHIDLPIAVGICGAYAGSFHGWWSRQPDYLYFDFVSGFILLMLVGRWAQVVAVERNQRRLLRQQPTPPRVKVVTAAGNREVAPEQLRSGDVFVIPPGQVVPVEGRLRSAETALSLAWINGESEARVFRAGQRVPAGAQNVSRAALEVEATQRWEESLLAQLLQPVTRAPYPHRLLERVIQVYLIAIFAVAIVAGLGWWWQTRDPLQTGAVVTAILVVSCPCALGLAFPLADEFATVALRRRGVFVRTADLWPRLARVRQLIFDKTGTLTLETPGLVNPEALRGLGAEARAALYSLVRDNAHPVSRTLMEALLQDGPEPEPLAGEPVETVGQGVELGPWSLGRAGWRDAGPADGATVLAWAGTPVARFLFADAARADARVELAALARRGFAPSILSGDEAAKVRALARDLDLPEDRALGGLSPQEKAAWLRRHAPDDALMLGDGANDSLAFDAALCRGTPVIHRGVLEQKADFYYLGRGIAGLRALFDVDRARRQTHLVLLVFMVAYNVTAVGLAVAGLMNPLFAAVLMPLSSLATLAIVGVGMRGVWRITHAATPAGSSAHHPVARPAQPEPLVTQ